VIDSEGEQIGIIETQKAIELAQEEGFDLVEVSPNARPPVCKIMNFGKYKYELTKKEKESKKKQHVIHLKEVRFRPQIEKHDLDFKVKHIRNFIEQGNKVKTTVFFKGRELARIEFGYDILNKIKENLSDIAKLESPVKKEGRNLIAIFVKK